MKEFSPMNAAELFERLVDVYKKSFWPQMGFAAIIYAIGFAAIFVLTFILVFVAVFAAVIAMADGGSGGVVGIIIMVVLIVLPLFMLWNAFASAGHILLARQAFYGYKPSFSKLGLFKVFFRVFTVMLAQLLLIIPFLIVAGVAVGIVFFIVFVLAETTAAAVAGFIIYLLVIAAAYFIYANIFSLAVAVAVFERRYFFNAIVRSFQLIKPEFWRIFGIRLIWYVVGMVFSVSAQGVLSLIGTGWNMLGGTVNMGFGANLFIGFLVGFAGPVIVTLVAAPLNGILHSLIYFNQRMKTEGFDLEMRVGRLKEQL